MPKSGYLQRQAIREQAIVLAVENTTQQLMLDTLQVTMHREYGWGYDRIKALSEQWAALYNHFHGAIDCGPEQDVFQEHLDRQLVEIKKVLLYVMGAEGTITAEAAVLAWLATQKFDYLAGPDDLSAEEAGVIKTWLVNQRSDNYAIYKAVLPELAADSEAIVNFSASGILVDGETFTAAGYCGRIAGLIAGTPMTQSISYAALPEVEDIDRKTQVELDAEVGEGKLVLFHDGEKVKCGRGVNSLTTVTGRSDVWKKIKIVEILDMIQQDIRLTIQDNYIGKVSNSYDNKLQLVTAISVYLQTLAKDGLIEDGFTVGIDVDAQDAWLQEQGVSTVDMSEQEIKEANTGTHVFLQLFVTPIDAMEDVAVDIYL